MNGSTAGNSFYKHSRSKVVNLETGQERGMTVQSTSKTYACSSSSIHQKVPTGQPKHITERRCITFTRETESHHRRIDQATCSVCIPSTTKHPSPSAFTS